jgi:predicted NUDIX family NTP pyrophosphohydrolase
MQKRSAGLLMYKISRERKLKLFIVHPGGPFWKNKEGGAWSIAKGEVEDGKDMFEVAKKELKEETGIIAPPGKENYIDLGEITQKSGKIVRAWAFEGDWNGLLICSSWAEIEWPAKSGKKIKVPEVDKAGFFNIEEAKKMINPAQIELIRRLDEKIKQNEKAE